MPAPSNPQKPRIWTISPWKWFFSLHIGIWLLTALTIASIIGTLVPDSEPGARDSLQRAQRLVYYTWWYQSMLLLLAVNMTCTTIRTLTEKTLPLLRSRFIRAADFYAGKPSRTFRFDGDAALVADALAGRGFRTAVDGSFGYAVKGNLALFGAPIAHFGMVLVLLSGFAAAWVAREGSISLFEGGASEVMVQGWGEERSVVPLGFTLLCDDFDVGFFPKTDPPIPARYISTVTSWDANPPVLAERVEVNRSVKVNGWWLHQTGYQEVPDLKRFHLDIAETGGGPPFSLELSPGQTRLFPERREFLITLGQAHPYPWEIHRAGIRLAQGTLFQDVPPTAYRFHIHVKRSAEEQAPAELELALGEEVFVEEDTPEMPGLRLKVERFEPDFSMGQSGTIISRSRELNNPAVRVSLLRGEESVFSAWLFSRPDLKEMMSSMMQRQSAGYDLDFVRVSRVETEPAPETETASDPGPWQVKAVGSVPAYRTDLTITRNPAVPFIYAGCTAMMLGMLLAFASGRKEIWFRVNAEEKTLQAAARYRFPRETLDRGTLRALTALCGPDAAVSEKNTA